MAIKTNTTKTVERTSTALENKCKETQANLLALCKRAGVKTPKIIKVPLYLAPGDNDDVLFVGLNGVNFYFKRGQSVEMPREVFDIAINCGRIPKHYADLITPVKAEAAKNTEE